MRNGGMKNAANRCRQATRIKAEEHITSIAASPGLIEANCRSLKRKRPGKPGLFCALWTRSGRVNIPVYPSENPAPYRSSLHLAHDISPRGRVALRSVARRVGTEYVSMVRFR